MRGRRRSRPGGALSRRFAVRVAHDHDAVHRSRRAWRLLEHDQLLQLVPERRLAAVEQLPSERPADFLDARRCARHVGDRVLDLERVHRHLQRASARNRPSGALHRLLDVRTDAAVDGPDEHEPDALAVQASFHDRVVGRALVLRGGGELVDPLLLEFRLAVQPVDLRLEAVALRLAEHATPESPTPTRIPITRAMKTAARDATW